MLHVCGLETEYGLLAAGASCLDQEALARKLLAACPIMPRVPWDLSGESPNVDARDAIDVVEYFAPTHPAPTEAGFMLGNGARLYVDHGHPEYCTPECIDAESVVASDKAGERLWQRCLQALVGRDPRLSSIALFKNNSDGSGHSYGCHENYCMSVSAYRRLFAQSQAQVHDHLIPFLVSRSVFCGSGKVGSENGRSQVDFQISQRADFMETLLGIQTMSRRPIVNTRDEAHADGEKYRRLHVITGDANMAEVSTYLKVGTLQILLAMLEAGFELPTLELADPVSAMVGISHDPTCRTRVPLKDGRIMSAIEIQYRLADAAGRFLDGGRLGEKERRVWQRWVGVLDRLDEDPMTLDTTLDWVIKRSFFAGWRGRKGLSWNSAELKELDIRYHDTDRDRSLFYLLEGERNVERIVRESDISRAVTEPISPTRAVARARLLSDPSQDVRSASWSSITRACPSGRSQAVRSQAGRSGVVRLGIPWSRDREA